MSFAITTSGGIGLGCEPLVTVMEITDLCDFDDPSGCAAEIFDAASRMVKKLEHAEGKERMMVRLDEEDPSGAPNTAVGRDCPYKKITKKWRKARPYQRCICSFA